MLDRSLLLASFRLLFLVWLFWVPLPFGSVTEFARLPLVVPPLLLLAATLAVHGVTEGHRRAVRRSPLHRVWSAAGALFILLVLLQVMPLPKWLVDTLSPSAHAIWSSAEAMHAMMPASAGEEFPRYYRLSVTPAKTLQHLLLIVGYFATFQLGFLLYRERRHRMVFCWGLMVAGCLQVFYGLRAWAEGTQYGTHSIWGWHNARIFSRVTGTFVNPNHFAAWIALLIPLALTLALLAVAEGWRGKGSAGGRVAHFVSHGLIRFALAALAAVMLLAGVLMSQSRSVLIALVSGIGIAAAVYCVALLAASRRGRTRSSLRMAAIVVLIVELLIALAAAFVIRRMGTEATIGRLMTIRDQRGIVAGRMIGYEAAIGVWKRFPLFGSGLGSFENVVLMEQSMEMNAIFDHAHNDYLEIAATTGAIGLLILLGGLAGGLLVLAWLLARSFQGNAGEPESVGGRSAKSGRTEARLVIVGVLASLMVIALHSLVDFDLFIPAIPATLAALLGVCAAAAGSLRRPERKPGS
ncbi:MAG TPA: O-antigen ligase family protein [Thermoanaerobaculia bacterium]|nr:O-antigen ligase family protein [Thermoanaerobaculia bacterium]